MGRGRDLRVSISISQSRNFSFNMTKVPFCHVRFFITKFQSRNRETFRGNNGIRGIGSSRGVSISYLRIFSFQPRSPIIRWHLGSRSVSISYLRIFSFQRGYGVTRNLTHLLERFNLILENLFVSTAAGIVTCAS